MVAGERWLTVPGSSGVAFLAKAEKRRRAGWPGLTWSISVGAILTSTVSLASPGTMVARRAAGVMTPPTVKTVSSLTRPAIGARISERESRSSLARRRSLSSETLASTWRSSRWASVRAVSSTAMIWMRASLMRSRARAIEASISPRSPSRRAHSRLML
ncbi:hypothetical protein FG93_04523 [Bosea sp. LC85]|nr:hypothetical protein FG93_04523 [Bosea sp. LC85]